MPIQLKKLPLPIFKKEDIVSCGKNNITLFFSHDLVISEIQPAYISGSKNKHDLLKTTWLMQSII